MGCTYTEKENLEYLNSFREKAAQLRTPVSGSVDLTSRCNLKCSHCFFGEEREAVKEELSTERWLKIIDELTEAGCLNLLITGGEPLLKPGFEKIYTHAKNSGLIVTVFTNGTLVDKDIAVLFQELPPQAVEISLYGASKDVYESITGKHGSYEKCLSGIKTLLENNIRVKLKTVLMTKNMDEFHDIENMAAKFGVPFRFDAALFPCLDHDKAPLAFRVSPEEAVKKELSDPVRFSQWKNYYEKRENYFSETEKGLLYRCSAGITNFHITSKGIVKPCLMTNNISFSLSDSLFSKGWQKVMPQISERIAGSDFQCSGCEKIALCGYCPAFFELETGREDVHSDYLCETAQYRYEAICNPQEAVFSAFCQIKQDGRYGTRKQKERV
ncbi:MAG: radical SAM protein [Deltaproteobacteria bacterium]|nr:radical SAM protein [Deltaproteobacteria bacterium]MBW2218286.1 radical SAM protein [Deltaproteobacteria bacterium]